MNEDDRLRELTNFTGKLVQELCYEKKSGQIMYWEAKDILGKKEHLSKKEVYEIFKKQASFDDKLNQKLQTFKLKQLESMWIDEINPTVRTEAFTSKGRTLKIPKMNFEKVVRIPNEKEAKTSTGILLKKALTFEQEWKKNNYYKHQKSSPIDYYPSNSELSDSTKYGESSTSVHQNELV